MNALPKPYSTRDTLPENSPEHLRSVVRRHNVAIIAYIGMLAAWLFDFRSEGAGQGLALQSVFMFVYVFSFLIFVIFARYSQIVFIFPFLMVSVLFFFVGIFSGISLNQDVYGLFRNSFNVIIYIFSVFSSYVFLRMMRWELSIIRGILAIFSLLYLVSGFFIVYLFYGGVDVTSIRYEIIGTSVVLALCYVSLFLRFKLNGLEILAAVVVVAVIAISVTRTWVVVFALQAVAVVVFGGALATDAIRKTAVLGVILFASLGALQIAGVPIVERWTERLLASDRGGVDPTALTRERQIASMVDSISDRPVFGNGFFGQSSYWLEKELGGRDGDISGNGFGHNQDVSVIFVAGFLGGGPLLIWQYWMALGSLVFVYRLRSFGTRSDFAVLEAVSCLCVIGTLAYGQFGGTFGSRGMTLWYGVSTGLALGLKSLFTTLPDHGARTI